MTKTVTKKTSKPQTSILFALICIYANNTIDINAEIKNKLLDFFLVLSIKY